MPGLKHAKSHAEEFNEFDAKPVKDFDPEDDDQRSADSDASIDSGDDDAAREHYRSVGKSKLRQGRDPVSLGPQYKGSRVSRKDVEEDEDDSEDPFDGYGSSEDTDDADPSNNEAKQSSREGSDNGSLSNLDDDEGEDEDDDSEEEQDEEDEDADDRQELRSMMAKDTTSAVSQAAREDAEKGRAVKHQRQTFDSLLNARVKLQQALIASNTLPTLQTQEAEVSDEHFQKTEAALGRLLETMDGLRSSMTQEETGRKRKRLQFAPDMSDQAIWDHMQDGESERRKSQRSVMHKWSRRTDTTAAAKPTAGKLAQNVPQHGLIDVLDEQLANTDKLVKRTRIPRSSAPVQAKARVAESEEIYDDADFYGLLLKELLEQRSADNHAQATSDAVAESWRAARAARARNSVDTKASKGRKMRFTVHEKLQNFMVPEDRGTWRERQVDQLFGNLFGQSRGMNGHANGHADGLAAADDSDSDNAQQVALGLFRNS